MTWDVNGVHVHPDEKPQKATKGSASLMMRRKAWYAVVLPLALLAAIASRDTKALQEQETIAMEGTIAGVFLNAATNQFEMVTLPVPSNSADYYYADEESYVLRATFTSSLAPGNPTTQDFIIIVSATYYFDGPPQLVWNFGIQPGEITVGGKPYKVRIVWDPEGNVWLEIINDKGQVVARFPLRLVPPPGQLTVKVFLVDGEDIKNIQPFPDVTVEAWHKGKKKATKVTNSNGEALFPKLAPGEYTLIGLKGRPIPACPKVTYLVTVEKGVPNTTSIHFYLHKAIKGRVLEQTNTGSYVPLPGAKASLWKGGTKVSSDWTSDSDGYFFISSLEIDAALAQFGNGDYTVKVIPPSRSMMRPEPREATKDVTLTKCERTKPGDTCTRALTIDTGTFVFTYKPAFPGPGGG